MAGIFVKVQPTRTIDLSVSDAALHDQSITVRALLLGCYGAREPNPKLCTRRALAYSIPVADPNPSGSLCGSEPSLC
jgi:hypothetical protein